MGDRVGVRARVSDRARARSWGACRLLVMGRCRDKDKGNERVGPTIALQPFGPAWLRFIMKHFLILFSDPSSFHFLRCIYVKLSHLVGCGCCCTILSPFRMI